MERQNSDRAPRLPCSSAAGHGKLARVFRLCRPQAALLVATGRKPLCFGAARRKPECFPTIHFGGNPMYNVESPQRDYEIASFCAK